MEAPSRRRPYSWLAPLLPGAAHGLTTFAVGSPFDTVKTRVQVGMYSSTWRCLCTTVLQEGPLALYRGAWMPLVSLILKRPFEFAAFEWCSARFGKKDKGPFLGGFAAGVIAACLGCPFNVVKVQMQASRKDVYQHTLQACAEVWRCGGPLGFYRGFGASLVMSVPSTTFYLGCYGLLRETLPPSKWSPAVAGMAASLTMWTCLLPLDNVRTLIQAQPLAREKAAPSSWLAHFRGITHGPRGVLGLWAGWPAVATRAPLMSACSMVAYEQARGIADGWRQ